MQISELRNIAVIGAGDMGHGIAQAALMAGYTVNLCDIQEEFVRRGMDRIFASLDKFCAKGKIDAELVRAIKAGRLRGFVSIPEAVRDADFAVEVVPERMELKKRTLAAIDAAAPARTVIATNTSTMSITELAAATNRPDRVLGTHYFNPVVMMNLVEVICGEKTSEETLQFGCEYVKKLGKHLVVARKDRPGFIANRIAAPVIVYNGLCLDVDHLTPQDIDLSMMKTGQKMGPMELADYTNIYVMYCCQDYYHEHLSPEYGRSAAAQKLIEEKHYGRVSGQGYYTWPEKGRPVIDERYYTGKYDPDIPFFIQANEACKLVAEGVCSFRECDDAMIYGYNTQGPIAYIRRFETGYVAEKLREIAGKYGKTIFAPAELLVTGAYLE